MKCCALHSFCRKTTLTKHVKKNHIPGHLGAPYRLSGARDASGRYIDPEDDTDDDDEEEEEPTYWTKNTKASSGQAHSQSQSPQTSFRPPRGAGGNHNGAAADSPYGSPRVEGRGAFAPGSSVRHHPYPIPPGRTLPYSTGPDVAGSSASFPYPLPASYGRTGPGVLGAGIGEMAPSESIYAQKDRVYPRAPEPPSLRRSPVSNGGVPQQQHFEGSPDVDCDPGRSTSAAGADSTRANAFAVFPQLNRTMTEPSHRPAYPNGDVRHHRPVHPGSTHSSPMIGQAGGPSLASPLLGYDAGGAGQAVIDPDLEAAYSNPAASMPVPAPAMQSQTSGGGPQPGSHISQAHSITYSAGGNRYVSLAPRAPAAAAPGGHLQRSDSRLYGSERGSASASPAPSYPFSPTAEDVARFDSGGPGGHHHHPPPQHRHHHPSHGGSPYQPSHHEQSAMRYEHPVGLTSSGAGGTTGLFRETSAPQGGSPRVGTDGLVHQPRYAPLNVE